MAAIQLFLALTIICDAAWSQCIRPSSYSMIWSSGYQAEFNVPITQTFRGWRAELRFPHSTSSLDIWSATITANNGDKSSYNLGPNAWNANLDPGSNLALGFVIHYGDRDFDATGKKPLSQNEPCLFFNENGGALPVVTSRPAIPPAATAAPVAVPSQGSATVITNTKYNYDQVLGLSLLFYEAQRSGKLPADNRIPWRGDSSLNDKGVNGEDLTGGWHDAGDHVKFGLPMAGTTTMLLAGMIFFEDGYKAAGQYEQALRQIRWPLDYFIKCHVSQTRFYGQVGNGHTDHAWWGRPEDMNIDRPAYFVGDGLGGAEVLGETAAALAAGSIVFNKIDATYSRKLLTHARQIFEMAKANQNDYTIPIPDAASFYRSFSGFKDELAHGAAWLALATGEAAYRAEVATYLETGVVPSLDWDQKRPLAHLVMYHMTKSEISKTEIINYLREWLPGGSVTKTPKGLAWRQKWGPLRYSANSAFLALLAAKEGLNQASYISFAASQIHYMLGDAGRSYVVGFGNNPPLRPHHKAASCQPRNVKATCDWNDYNSPNPNPHVLQGALVGGPDEYDNYEDVRSNYVTNEVATDYNSGFQGALAGLKYFAVNGLLQ